MNNKADNSGTAEASSPVRRAGDDIEIPGDYQYRALTEGFPIQRYWHFSKQAIIDSLLTFTPEDRALDCGCGSGVIANFLADRCREVVGVDGSPRAVDFAQKQFRRPNLKFIQALVHEIDYPPGYFTKVFCLEVFEHLYEPQVSELLGVFHKLLAPGGTVFLTTPNYRGLWPLVEKAADRSGAVAHMDESQHVTHYHRRKLEKQTAAAGFQIVRGGTFCTFAPFAAAISRRAADALFTFERKVNLPFGNLLYLVAEKPKQSRT